MRGSTDALRAKLVPRIVTAGDHASWGFLGVGSRWDGKALRDYEKRCGLAGGIRPFMHGMHGQWWPGQDFGK
jgi:hypothetical protein